jgi:hypothetical protein
VAPVVLYGIRFAIRKRDDIGAVCGSGALETALKLLQEKWNPVFRPKMRQCKNVGAASVPGLM